jgi:hypothetical protein
VAQQQGMIRFQNIVEYPFMPQVSRFNPDNLIGKDLEQVDFPFASALASLAAVGAGLTLVPIAWTSDRSGMRGSRIRRGVRNSPFRKLYSPPRRSGRADDRFVSVTTSAPIARRPLPARRIRVAPRMSSGRFPRDDSR